MAARETPGALSKQVSRQSNLGAKDYADIALREAINDGDVVARGLSLGPAGAAPAGIATKLLPPALHFRRRSGRKASRE